ncbi:MAG: DUF4173 domain-containing protein [Stappiaceae bacterium]
MATNPSETTSSFHLTNTRQISFLITVSLVLLVDYLFYAHPLGINIPLFLVAMALSIVATQPEKVSAPPLLQGALVLIILLLPGVEATTPLSIVLGTFGLLVFTLFARHAGSKDIFTMVAGAVKLLPLTLQSLVQELGAARAHSKTMDVRKRSAGFGRNWFLPIVLTLLFLALFIVANPIFEGMIASIDIWKIFAYFDGMRLLFWVLIGALSFGYLRVAPARQHKGETGAPLLLSKETKVSRSRFMNEAQIVRSLLLFNLLFAIQTALDVTYLWGGMKLPDGMSYADYAHRGAYALIITALLAAAFVLYASGKSTADRASPFKQGLLLLWTVQNVALVLSSVMRLSLYVDIYALTYWRIAAFIWMMIVFAGLVLIGVRILLTKTNRWLISANLWVLITVLYVTSFINIPALIAQHNVSVAISGKGAGLDTPYLISLGEEAIPAIDRLLERNAGGAMSDRSRWSSAAFASQRDTLVADFIEGQREWRLWNLRRMHLKDYLEDYDRKQANRPDADIY